MTTTLRQILNALNQDDPTSNEISRRDLELTILSLYNHRLELLSDLSKAFQEPSPLSLLDALSQFRTNANDKLRTILSQTPEQAIGMRNPRDPKYKALREEAVKIVQDLANNQETESDQNASFTLDGTKP